MNAQRYFKTKVILSTAVAVLAIPFATVAQDNFRAIPDPLKLQWADTGPPFPKTQITVVDGDPSNAGPFVMRFRCPDDYKIAPHTHPTTEVVTVLEGTFHAGLGDTFDASTLTPVRRGGFFVMPGGTSHFAICKGPMTVIEMHATGPWDTKMLKDADSALQDR